MTNAIIATQVAIMKGSLKRVHDLATTISERENRLRTFGERLDRVDADLKSFRAATVKKQAALSSRDDDLTGDDANSLMEHLEGIPLALRPILDVLKSALEDVRAINAGFIDLPGERLDLRQALIDTAANVSGRLKPSDRKTVETLFADYVDVIAGVALRDAGFAQLSEVFLVAENLTEVCGWVAGTQLRSFAVPSLIERRGLTDSMVFRLGFPEWSLWGIPLIQHGFGHAMVRKKHLIVQTDEIRAAAQADIAACLFTGPAYACAALAIRLDPAVAGAGEGVSRRSAAILNALEFLSKHHGSSTLPALVARLKTEWLEAVLSSGGDADAVQKELDEATTQGLADKIIEQLDPEGKAWFWASRWSKIQELTGYLKEGKSVDLGANKDERAGMLIMLVNAAWLCRISAKVDGEVTDQAKLEEIENYTLKLCSQAYAAFNSRVHSSAITRPTVPT